MTRKPFCRLLGGAYVLLIGLIALEAAVHHRIGESLADYIRHQPGFTQ